MSALHDVSTPHPSGCGCSACCADAMDGSGTSGSSSTGTEVSDYTALLYYRQSDSLRWNGQTNVGTQVVVTYSFTEAIDLPDPSGDPFGATGYWAYTEAQRTLFREVIAKFEAVAGIKFVEIEGSSMINVYGSTGGTAGGWANVSQATNRSTNNGDLTNNYMSMSEGDYGYQVNLHELGHAMGLQHPFEGMFVLEDSLDTQTNTVMTYNIETPYVTELGIFDIQALVELYGAADSFDRWAVAVNASNVITIRATNNAEIVLATDQDTIVRSGGGNDEVFGREGNDWLNGGIGEDTVIGAAGDDTVLGSHDNDLLIGDFETLPYSGTGNDLLNGGLGDDTAYGGGGNDTLIGAGGNDSLFGGYDDDRLIGVAGNDLLDGDFGNDTLVGGAGNDTLNGGSNDDRLIGVGGHDSLDGGFGNDFLSGGQGNDTLYSGDGDDRMQGDAGADVFLFLNADAFEVNKIVDFTVGEDLIDVSSFGFSTLGQFTVTTAGANTTLSYSNWFELVLNNFTQTLSDTDFIFA